MTIMSNLHVYYTYSPVDHTLGMKNLSTLYLVGVQKQTIDLILTPQNACLTFCAAGKLVFFDRFFVMVCLFVCVCVHIRMCPILITNTIQAHDAVVYTPIYTPCLSATHTHTHTPYNLITSSQH